MIINKQLFRFTTSLHFELFFALQTMTDPESRIHPGWKREALAALPSRFHRRFELLGPSAFLWACVPDALQNEPGCRDFDGIVSELERLPLPRLQKTLLEGVLHDPDLAAQMLSGKSSLRDAVAGVRRVKREWLAFVGLYPYDKKAPLARALESLLRAPEEFRKEVLSLMSLFWKSSFQITWSRLQPQLKQSLEEKERLFESCSLQEFADLALLRVEINEAAGFLRAVRGGFRLPLKEISRAYFFPSCFNDKRHWTCYPGPRGRVVCFPYFDPAISLDLPGRLLKSKVTEPELDPALVFAALGDSTRYAMVSLLARTPASSADLSRTLALSRPTVSHHIHVLREAGLMREEREGSALRLSVNRTVIEALSELTVKKLFDSTGTIEIKKTRKK